MLYFQPLRITIKKNRQKLRKIFDILGEGGAPGVWRISKESSEEWRVAYIPSDTCRRLRPQFGGWRGRSNTRDPASQPGHAAAPPAQDAVLVRPLQPASSYPTLGTATPTTSLTASSSSLPQTWCPSTPTSLASLTPRMPVQGIVITLTLTLSTLIKVHSSKIKSRTTAAEFNIRPAVLLYRVFTHQLGAFQVVPLLRGLLPHGPDGVAVQLRPDEPGPVLLVPAQSIRGLQWVLTGAGEQLPKIGRSMEIW